MRHAGKKGERMDGAAAAMRVERDIMVRTRDAVGLATDG